MFAKAQSFCSGLNVLMQSYINFSMPAGDNVMDLVWGLLMLCLLIPRFGKYLIFQSTV